MEDRSIIYVIKGFKFSRMALRSVISLREFGGRAGKLPIHIYYFGKPELQRQFEKMGCVCATINPMGLTESLSVPYPCNWSIGYVHPIRKEDLSDTHIHRLSKCLIMVTPPRIRNVFIDADTFIQNDFVELFELMPKYGVVGIEDGNFDSHLGMAKRLFIKGRVKDTREFVKSCLEVDYGLKPSSEYAPYFNVGVFGFHTSQNTRSLGAWLWTTLLSLYTIPNYNPHDEQLPLNAALTRFMIPTISVNPIYNYTRSRMKKNQRENTHDTIKQDVRVIHNRTAQESEWIKEKSEHVKRILNEMIG